MVRRSTVDRSPQPVVYDAGYVPGAGDRAPGRNGRDNPSAAWRGAGGRWLVWVFRGVLWVVLIVIGYRGVTAIVLNETVPAPPATAARAAGARFPAALASAYALQFGQVYLNASPATAGRRASELAAFLPAGSDPQLGWNGTGSLRLQSEQVAGISVSNARQAVVTLLARVSGRLMELGVPIYSDGHGLVVSGEPAWLPAPARAILPSSSPASSDPATQAVLMRQLPAFFQAYASGNQVTLGRYLAPGTAVTGLAGQVVFGSLASVTVPPGGPVRHAVATVLWRVPGVPSAGVQAATGQPGAAQPGAAQQSAGLEMSYALTIVKLSGTWYIRHIGSPTLTPGLP